VGPRHLGHCPPKTLLDQDSDHFVAVHWRRRDHMSYQSRIHDRRQVPQGRLPGAAAASCAWATP